MTITKVLATALCASVLGLGAAWASPCQTLEGFCGTQTAAGKRCLGDGAMPGQNTSGCIRVTGGGNDVCFAGKLGLDHGAPPSGCVCVNSTCASSRGAAGPAASCDLTKNPCQ